MTTLKIKTQDETRNGNILFENVGDYSIMANYSKKETGEFQSMAITVTYGMKQATFSQYGEGSNVTYSYAPDVTEAQTAEINDIFKQAVSIIKTTTTKAN